jgi:hypothetical protein
MGEIHHLWQMLYDPIRVDVYLLHYSRNRRLLRANNNNQQPDDKFLFFSREERIANIKILPWFLNLFFLKEKNILVCIAFSRIIIIIGSYTYYSRGI